MEQEFVAAWLKNREAAGTLGVRLRPLGKEEALAAAHRSLSGRRCSEGFDDLAALGRLDLSLEALAVDKRFTGLFSDREAGAALERLLSAGYSFLPPRHS